ncbi:hypothetical protein AQUCO_06600038v1 [Aquilegia coerulea]|uniref:MORF/ORRM1/DAG-like MORF domain-containing protein n=1 Tax=Aquilegia coerulea TaxID=218851 RepID=A0A2G5CC45_AQUCA|nr:hypothetical protein AQUCO_06600038v1 [Aquilegia coerulea]
MNLLCLEVATEQELFNVYINTVARIVGSVEAAKKRIYLVSCGDSYGFGVELDQKDKYKLSVMGEVMLALPDCCFHVRNMNHNGMNILIETN